MKEQVIRPEAPSDAYVVLGYVYSHDAFQDGDDIVTTAIVKVDARNIVTTQSGTLYALGTPARVDDNRIPDARSSGTSQTSL